MRSVLLALLLSSPVLAQETRIERDWMTMSDGVRLSVTHYRPPGKGPYPVIVEMLPYRKDDMFLARDYPIHTYFADHGIATVKVDIRGTGSSEGCLPPGEYSPEEIDDACEVIRQAAALPWSNGKVGMFGISWGGFNAIQVARRAPPALKAILAVDASDDLYHDDVHYQDGVLHFDDYHVAINRENALPDSLEYRVDEDYFRNRFDREPWLLENLRHQRDGEYWRQRSDRFQSPPGLALPAYLIGGLLDLYRDSPLRMAESARAPVQIEIGPYNHAWPDNGRPGPNYEWRQLALDWWRHWLADQPAAHLPHPPWIYVRGQGFREGAYPPQSTRRLYLAAAALHDQPGQPGWGQAELEYDPGRGVAAGFWWGDETQDVARDAQGALVFDSAPLTSPLVVAGYPQVAARISLSAPQANLCARLEDVSPQGRVELVTGALLNGSQRNDRLHPQPFEPEVAENVRVPLHFTSWTFAPGHRIRVSLSNAQFPMAWPSPTPLKMKVEFGPESWLELPQARPGSPPLMPAVEPRREHPGVHSLPCRGWPYRMESSRPGDYRWEGEDAFATPNATIRVEQSLHWKTTALHPGDSLFESQTDHTIRRGEGEVLRLRAECQIRSTTDLFVVHYRRLLWLNGKLIRERRWEEEIARDFQ